MTGSQPRRRTPKGPLVLDTRELGRRPGSMRPVRTQVELPADLGTEMMWVAPGATGTLDLRLESVIEGVLVSGTVVAPLQGECARCLEGLSDVGTVELRELFYYPDRAADMSQEDEDVRVLVDDHADLAPVVRDALVLDLPLSPTCRPDCAGLCVDCGARLDDVGPDHSHARSDPRWAALSGLAQDTPTGAEQGPLDPDENKEKE
ncbi:YceD family protein [Frankia canadensis]|nr:YceD family protein [Frankia canadensis]